MTTKWKFLKKWNVLKKQYHRCIAWKFKPRRWIRKKLLWNGPLLALQNGKPVFFPNRNLYIMAKTWGDPQPSLSHLDRFNHSKQFLSMFSPIFTISLSILIDLYSSLFNFMLLPVDSFGVRVALQPHLRYESDLPGGTVSTLFFRSFFFLLAFRKFLARWRICGTLI